MIEERFGCLLNKYQVGLETLMRNSDFVFHYVIKTFKTG